MEPWITIHLQNIPIFELTVIGLLIWMGISFMRILKELKKIKEKRK